jgi:hypothetical protein
MGSSSILLPAKRLGQRDQQIVNTKLCFRFVGHTTAHHKLSKTFDPSPMGCGEASIGFPLVSFFCATAGSD